VQTSLSLQSLFIVHLNDEGDAVKLTSGDAVGLAVGGLDVGCSVIFGLEVG